MWHMPWIFWVFVMVMVLRGSRYHRWGRRRRWEMRHAGDGSDWGPPPWAVPPWARRRAEAAQPAAPAPPALKADPDYVEALESRIAQLEERLDFTEKLLSGRRETTPAPAHEETTK